MAGSLSMMRVVDSHTAGEPTRVIVEGAPDLGGGSIAERRERFRRDLDRFRSGTVSEPRGSDILVGALLCNPVDSSCAAGVIFFDNAGYLDICGHGIIGLVATLDYLGRVKIGPHRIETPLGVLSTELHASGDISFENVASYRHKQNVAVQVDGFGTFTGDVAWGGNWFFLVDGHREELDLRRVERLTQVTTAIRQALARSGITGAGGHPIDHIALFGPARRPDAHSRNFVLGPANAYDRSPNATATSARVACLFEDGKLTAGQALRQEGIVGTVFDGSVNAVNGAIHPTIRGTAYITADSMLIVDQHDPFCWGIRQGLV
jgi:4-hydroxyproline epimerase